MADSNFKTQPPIIGFFNKHKWRIIIPVLYTFLFIGLPRYFHEQPAANQQYIFIKSANLSKSELNSEVLNTSKRILSDDSLLELANEYNLFAAEREKGLDERQLIKKMRSCVDLNVETDNRADGAMVTSWVHFPNQSLQTVTDASASITERFKENRDFQVMNYISDSYDADPFRNLVLAASLFQGLTMFSIPLILLWELPFLFYSEKTKKTVFEPIEADWEDELHQAKLNGQIWKAFKINIYYSVVFVNALWQKSPIGDSVEFVKKLIN